MAKDKISRNEYLQLIGLQTLARQYDQKQKEIEASLLAVLGNPEKPESGSAAGDVVWGERDIDWLLEAYNVTVEPEVQP